MTPVLSILLVVGGGGVAAHAISDIETGNLWHSTATDLRVAMIAALAVLTGIVLM